MVVSGELEKVPLRDVLQVLAHSLQSGALAVESASASCTVLFDRGRVVCAASTATRALLERTASEKEPVARDALRRALAMAVLTEALVLRHGVFHFKRAEAPLSSIEGVDAGVFYAGEAMDMGELMLVYATRIDTPTPERSQRRAETPARERAHPRFAPTLIPAEIHFDDSKLEGHLTNLSEGGAMFQAGALPPRRSWCGVVFWLPGESASLEAVARVVWVDSQRGAGLAFGELSSEVASSLGAYLTRIRAMAAEYASDTDSTRESRPR